MQKLMLEVLAEGHSLKLRAAESGVRTSCIFTVVRDATRLEMCIRPRHLSAVTMPIKSV